MQITLRTDASLQIGIGHVMRCLTLADALKARGHDCHFICRAHDGHLVELIRAKGHAVTVLPTRHVEQPAVPCGRVEYASWLGVSQEQDAQDTVAALAAYGRSSGRSVADWLIMDHYALDSRWESMVRSCNRHLMVIDDLADREHLCDLLLDQTFGRQDSEYRPLVPQDCTVLCGSRYALLRPDFAEWRLRSLARRAEPELRRLLISMGGVDSDNATGQVLEALQGEVLPADCELTVVMGASAPWLEEVRRQAVQMSRPTHVLVAVDDMAQLMAESDLAIGAAGATSWERCCLGLPTIMVVLAENQRAVARGLRDSGAAMVLDSPRELAAMLPVLLAGLRHRPDTLVGLSERATNVTDGRGVAKVIDYLELA